MPLSDMLFANTHNVEQIVDIKHKKTVDKVLLKVVKVVRERTSIEGWIKIDSDLRKDFQVTDRQMKSICGALNSYYNVSLDPEKIVTPGDMVGEIKIHKAQATDSLYLIDSGTVDMDKDDDLEPKENLEVKPEIIKVSEPGLPSDLPVPESSEPSIEGGEDEVGDESIVATMAVSAALALAGGWVAGRLVFGPSWTNATKTAFSKSEWEKALKGRREYKDLFDLNEMREQTYKLMHSSIPTMKTAEKIDEAEMKKDSMAVRLYWKLYEGISDYDYPETTKQITFQEQYYNDIYKKSLHIYTKDNIVVKRSTTTLSDAGYKERVKLVKAKHQKLVEFLDQFCNWYNHERAELLYATNHIDIQVPKAIYRPSVKRILLKYMTDLEECYKFNKKCIDTYIKAYKDELDILKKQDPSKRKDEESKEGLFDYFIGGAGAGVLATTIVKLYKQHEWDKLVETMGKNYDKICADIRKNHKDDPAFARNRAILYPINSLRAAFEERITQLKKLVNMPFPVMGEDPEKSLDRLKAYFGQKISARTSPGDPSYMTLQDAGYLNASAVKSLIVKIKECYDLQDAFDHKFLPYVHGAEGSKYMDVLTEVGAADYYHAIYKEEWTDHFGTNVMKAIVNGLNGESNKDVGSEQMEAEPAKVEASMESVVPTQESNSADSWASMMDSF